MDLYSSALVGQSKSLSQSLTSEELNERIQDIIRVHEPLNCNTSLSNASFVNSMNCSFSDLNDEYDIRGITVAATTNLAGKRVPFSDSTKFHLSQSSYSSISKPPLMHQVKALNPHNSHFQRKPSPSLASCSFDENTPPTLLNSIINSQNGQQNAIAIKNKISVDKHEEHPQAKQQEITNQPRKQDLFIGRKQLNSSNAPKPRNLSNKTGSQMLSSSAGYRSNKTFSSYDSKEFLLKKNIDSILLSLTAKHISAIKQMIRPQECVISIAKGLLHLLLDARRAKEESITEDDFGEPVGVAATANPTNVNDLNWRSVQGYFANSSEVLAELNVIVDLIMKQSLRKSAVSACSGVIAKISSVDLPQNSQLEEQMRGLYKYLKAAIALSHSIVSLQSEQQQYDYDHRHSLERQQCKATTPQRVATNTRQNGQLEGIPAAQKARSFCSSCPKVKAAIAQTPVSYNGGATGAASATSAASTKFTSNSSSQQNSAGTSSGRTMNVSVSRFSGSSARREHLLNANGVSEEPYQQSMQTQKPLSILDLVQQSDQEEISMQRQCPPNPEPAPVSSFVSKSIDRKRDHHIRDIEISEEIISNFNEIDLVKEFNTQMSNKDLVSNNKNKNNDCSGGSRLTPCFSARESILLGNNDANINRSDINIEEQAPSRRLSQQQQSSISKGNNDRKREGSSSLKSLKLLGKIVQDSREQQQQQIKQESNRSLSNRSRSSSRSSGNLMTTAAATKQHIQLVRKEGSSKDLRSRNEAAADTRMSRLDRILNLKVRKPAVDSCVRSFIESQECFGSAAIIIPNGSVTTTAGNLSMQSQRGRESSASTKELFNAGGKSLHRQSSVGKVKGEQEFNNKNSIVFGLQSSQQPKYFGRQESNSKLTRSSCRSTSSKQQLESIDVLREEKMRAKDEESSERIRESRWQSKERERLHAFLAEQKNKEKTLLKEMRQESIESMRQSRQLRESQMSLHLKHQMEQASNRAFNSAMKAKQQKEEREERKQSTSVERKKNCSFGEGRKVDVTKVAAADGVSQLTEKKNAAGIANQTRNSSAGRGFETNVDLDKLHADLQSQQKRKEELEKTLERTLEVIFTYRKLASQKKM